MTGEIATSIDDIYSTSVLATEKKSTNRVLPLFKKKGLKNKNENIHVNEAITSDSRTNER